MGSTQSNTKSEDYLDYFFGKSTNNQTKKTNRNTVEYRDIANNAVLKINGQVLPYNTTRWNDIITDKMSSESADELTIEVVGKPSDNLEKKLNNMGIKINYVDRKTNMTGGNDPESDSVFSTTSEATSSTSDIEVSSLSSPSVSKSGSDSESDSMKKKHIKKVDENDSPNDDLVVEDEIITESDGIVLESDDINTSDIMKMQSRLFNSDTDTADDTYTDIVRDAMHDVKRKHNIYDSEEKEIVDMKSESMEYMKRPINKNMKYY